MQGVLAEISPADLTAFAVTAALVMFMTLAGSPVPALRAVRINPIEVIRSE